MEKIGWLDIFKRVCQRNNGALSWELPEPWVHAEIFSTLKEKYNDWIPFPTEVPYITYYPVMLPKISNRNWKNIGAVKYIDLCIRSADNKNWIWFEFKVRNCGFHKNKEKANLESMDAFKRDIVALIGFSPELTAKTWEEPDIYTKSYRFDALLLNETENIKNGNHHFVSVYLHLYDELDENIWEMRSLEKKIDNYFNYRKRHSYKKLEKPDIKANIFNKFYQSHSLVICSW